MLHEDMAGTCGGRGYVISTSHPSVPNPPVPERGTSDPAHPVRSCIPAATQSRAIWAADLPPSSCPPCDPNRQGAPRYRATRLNWRSSQPLVTYSLAHKYTKSQRPLFGRSGRRGALNGSLRRVSFSCWPGAIGCVCVWWSGSRVVRGTARWCGSTRSTWRVHQGYTAGVRGLLCRLCAWACRACGRVRLGGARAVVPRRRETWRPEVLLPAVLGSCTGLYVAVRRIGGADGPAHVHIADSVAAGGIMRGRFRRSGVIWRCRQERSVKPSAQPTLVRTQHLPPPAKTARWLRKRGPAGRFLLVTMCISVCHCGSMRSSGCVHMVYSVRAERAVRKTARFAV